MKIFHNVMPLDFLKATAPQLHALLGGPVLFRFDPNFWSQNVINTDKLVAPIASEVLEVSTEDFLLSGPSGVCAPLFVSTLLHGNEHTGFMAIQSLFQDFLRAFSKSSSSLIEETSNPRSEAPLRPLMLFIGNTEAAAQNLRLLEHQTDFNRLWAGHSSPEGDIALAVLEEIRRASPFAVVDLHNNTGKNPHYSCVGNLEPASLHLATLFSKHVMLFTKPESTLGFVCSKHFPSVTLEAGLSGETSGVENVREFLRTLLYIDELSNGAAESEEIYLYENFCCVKLKEDVRIHVCEPMDSHFENDFALCAEAINLNRDILSERDGSSVFELRSDIDMLNFVELTAVTPIGYLRCGSESHAKAGLFPFELVSCENDALSAEEYFLLHEDGRLSFQKGVLASMLTPKAEAIRQDCLCYLMRRISLS